MKFFAYGTLKVDGQFAVNFDEVRTKTQPAILHNFDMFDINFYPGAVPSINDHSIKGELHEFESSCIDIVLAKMDRIEGYMEHCPEASLFVRKEFKVELEDGSFEKAQVYIFNNRADKPMHKIHDRVLNGVWNN